MFSVQWAIISLVHVTTYA